MPIYEYSCSTCNHAFEHLHRTLGEPLPDCPACGASKPTKQFSAFSATVTASTPDHCSMGTCPSGSCCGSSCPAG